MSLTLSTLTKILLLILIIGCLFIVAHFQGFFNPCLRTFSYDIGRFDDRFGISRDEFLQAIQDAENIWEEATGFDHFVYKPGGKVRIHLEYDERQEKSDKWNDSSQTLDQLAKQLQQKDAEYQSLTQNYRTLLEQYDAEINQHNANVNRYSQQDNVSQAIIDELNANQDLLIQKKQDLDRMRNDLNQLANNNNDLIKAYNQRLNDQNAIFEDKEYEKGLYRNTQDIYIYQFDDSIDLRNLLAHELGHVIGLNHVAGSNSIMFWLTTQTNMHHRSISDQDLEALQQLCSPKFGFR